MWEPQHLTALWASSACYRDTFTLLYFTLLIIIIIIIIIIAFAGSEPVLLASIVIFINIIVNGLCSNLVSFFLLCILPDSAIDPLVLSSARK
jgi:hypothetical protein